MKPSGRSWTMCPLSHAFASRPGGVVKSTIAIANRQAIRTRWRHTISKFRIWISQIAEKPCFQLSSRQPFGLPQLLYGGLVIRQRLAIGKLRIPISTFRVEQINE